jgi:hypothetical protein
MNNFENLEWNKYYASTMSAKKKGKFTDKGIRKELQKMSNSLKKEGKDASVGCALHYKDQNVWASAIITKAGLDVKLFSEDMYPTGSEKYNLFAGDKINEIQFFIENNQHTENKSLHHV